jgi:hypothetical protein
MIKKVVKAVIKTTVDKAKRWGEFILGTSDYFHEATPLANVAAMAEGARGYGNY